MFGKLTKLSGWGNLPYSPSFLATISDEKRLEPFSTEPSLIPRGLGRSYADQAVNSGHQVLEFTPMNRFLSFDRKTGILECEAGLSLDEIITALGPEGFFPLITPGTRYVTIGGAIACDVHGKAHHVDGSFIESVLEFKIRLGSGKTVIASRKKNKDLFQATFGGMGLTGLILSAKIQLRKVETNYFTQKVVVANNLDEMMDAIDASDEKFDYSVAWIDPLASGKSLGRGVLTVGNEAKLSDLPTEFHKNPLKIVPKAKITIPPIIPSFALNGITVRIINRVIHFVQSSGKPIAHYPKFFYPLDAFNLWNRGYGKRGFIQYQFVIPLENGREALRELLEMISKSGCLPFLNVLKKFGDKKGGDIAFPKPGYTLAIDFPMTRKLPAFTKKLDQAVLDRGGRIYIGKDGVLDREMFHAMYPHAKDWLKVKKKYDPENRLSSNLSRRLGLDLQSAPEDE